MNYSLEGIGDAPRRGATQSICEGAPAKVNLTLHVIGKRSDGYHELQSLVVFADLCDELTFTEAPSDSLTVEGPFAGDLDGENLILKAKRAVSFWLGFEISGHFQLQKNIPVAAGLGGGSADAAAAIRALLAAYDVSPDIAALADRAAAIGADVPVCLRSRAAMMAGLGEKVAPLENAAPLPAILVNPGVGLSTAAVFKQLGAPSYLTSPKSTPAVFGWRNAAEAAAYLKDGRNDLQTSAIALAPAIGEVLKSISALPGCLLARLSGSGATCFGLFPTKAEADAAANALRKTHPAWWVQPVTLS
jgi:4-diphosphocytidyl-2-C-methyl-D-erythritol kinase